MAKRFGKQGHKWVVLDYGAKGYCPHCAVPSAWPNIGIFKPLIRELLRKFAIRVQKTAEMLVTPTVV
jgi:hypothetical protein